MTSTIQKIYKLLLTLIIQLYYKWTHLHNFYVILIIIYEFSDDPSCSRHSKLLHSLFTRGRHTSISTIVSTQQFTAVAQIIRVSATILCVYRLRNNKDLECLLDEVSGTVGRNQVLEVYNLATTESYSFYILI